MGVTQEAIDAVSRVWPTVSSGGVVGGLVLAVWRIRLVRALAWDAVLKAKKIPQKERRALLLDRARSDLDD